MKKPGKTILLAGFGGLLGAVVGGLVFFGAGYAMAEFFGIEHRESQAYFRVFLAMPLGALVGLVTGAAGMAAMTAKSKLALRSVAMVGTILLLVAVALGIHWETPKRPARFRVQNQTGAPLERTYLGHDFRRATALGHIASGAVSDYHRVDLDERGSFNGVRAVFRGAHIQLTLDLPSQTSLLPGSYTYVVRELANKATLDIIKD